MEKKSKTKLILILVSLFAIVILVFSLSGCQVLSRFTGGSANTANSSNAVETFTVKRADIIQSMSTTGTVDSSETKNLPVRVAGEVLESTKIGSQVKKGDLLLRVDNTDLLLSIKQSQINVEVAEASLKNTQISYQAALDANHIAVQTAQLDIQSSQQSVDAAAVSADNTAASADNTERTGNSSIESAQLALEKAQDSFNFSIAQAQLSLNQANDQLSIVRSRDNSSIAATDKLTQLEYSGENAALSYNSTVAAATNSLESATASLSEADAQAQANNENAGNSYKQALISYNQALISQSKIYWSTLSSLQKAKATIQSTVLSISTSQKQVELAKISLETASKYLNNSSILAPFDGIILASTYNKGEIAANNSTAITIASSDFLVKSSVNETDISKVAVGNKVTLTFDAYPEQEFEAEVADISGAPTVLNNITSYAITARLKNTDKLKLFYGLTTNLTVITAEAKNALIVPVQAVYTENGKQYVDVIDNTQTTDQQSGSTVPTGTTPDATRTSRTLPNGGTFPDRATTQNTRTSANSKNTGDTGTSATKKVEITTGINNYTYYEVLSGLKEGDTVITSSS